MSATVVAQLVAALGGGALVQAVISYLRDRRQIKANGDIAAAATPFHIEAVGLETMEAKLAYLQKLLDSMDKQNARMQAQLEATQGERAALETQNRELRQRCWRLEEEVQDVRTKCRELDMTCGRLQEQLTAIRWDAPPGPPGQA